VKILLTGEPRSGKTTLLEGFIEALPDKQGFVTREVREDGERVGFELVSSLGQSATLANVNSDSTVRVSRYGVEVERFDDFLADLPPVEADNLLYVDEIGQMELFSDSFKKLIGSYLNSKNSYAGTITSVYRDDFTEQVLEREDIILLNIGQNNREQISDALQGLAANIALLPKLSPAIQNGLTEMARYYAATSSFTQLKKLFKNAIKYLAEDRVVEVDAGTFKVKGNTDEHTVTRETEWACDCDLFRGAGSFEGDAGECSHIQSTKLKSLEGTS
jgi:nucleoside-triphosphatase